MDLETRISALEARIVALESDNLALKHELSATQSIVNCMENQRIPWNLCYVEIEAYKDGEFHWLPIKKFPIAERNLLIKELHRQGIPINDIPAALYQRNHKNPQGGLVGSGIVHKVLGGGRGAQETE